MSIEELKRLHAAATPPPWAVHYATYKSRPALVQVTIAEDSTAYRERYIGERIQDEEDAALIAAMRNALPALLAVVEAARAMDNRLRRRHTIIVGDLNDAQQEETQRTIADLRAALAALS